MYRSTFFTTTLYRWRSARRSRQLFSVIPRSVYADVVEVTLASATDLRPRIHVSEKDAKAHGAEDISGCACDSRQPGGHSTAPCRLPRYSAARRRIVDGRPPHAALERLRSHRRGA